MRLFVNYFPLVIIFFLAFIIRIWNINDPGRAWDEQFIAEDGYRFVQLAKKLDFQNDFWWRQNPDHPVLVRYVHGIASQFDIRGFDKTGYPILDYDLFFNKFISVLLTAATSVIVFLVGRKYYSQIVGFFGGIIFAMLPILVGHSRIGLYEPFIVFFFTLCYFLFLVFLEKPTVKKAIIIGILSGLAIQAKETNILLYPLYLLTYWIQYIHSKKPPHPTKVLPQIALIWILGIFVFFLVWPWAFIHLGEMISYVQARRLDTSLSIPEVLFGKLVLTPRIYYVLFFLITTPIVILSLFFAGLLRINKSKSWILYSFVLWFVFPFIQSFYPNRQQGIRYIIEIYAPLSLIAAIGFDSLISLFTKKTKTKLIFFIPVFLYMGYSLIRVSPYYLDYFNEVVGGVSNVYEKRLFQYGYWGHGVKEATIYLKKVAPHGSTVGLAVSPVHITPPLPEYKAEKFNPKKTYDYVLVNYFTVIREGFPIETLIYPNYNLIHTVTVDKAALVYIFKRK